MFKIVRNEFNQLRVYRDGQEIWPIETTASHTADAASQIESVMSGVKSQIDILNTGLNSKNIKSDIGKSLVGSAIIELTQVNDSKVQGSIAKMSIDDLEEEPELASFILDHPFEEMIEEIKKASITPTTFMDHDLYYGEQSDVREEIQNNFTLIKSLKEKALAFKTSWDQMKGVFEGVISEGEDKSLKQNFKVLGDVCDKKIKALVDYNTELAEYDLFISSNTKCGLFYVARYEDSKSTLQHYGINTIMTSAQSTALVGVLKSVFNPPVLNEAERKDNASESAISSVSAKAKVATKSQNLKKGTISKNGSVKSQAEDKDNEDLPNPVQKVEICLHPLEVQLFKKAIKDLNKDTTKDLNKDTTSVLVDIFERKDGSISIDENGKCKVHTIILYKQFIPLYNQDKTSIIGQKTQFVVIDPTNSDHSKHIEDSANLLRIFGEITNSAPSILIPPSKIYNPPPQDQNNNADSKVGPEAYKYRDCTDIAIKIAFGLNLNTEIITKENFAKLPFIKEISNNAFVESLIDKETQKKPIPKKLPVSDAEELFENTSIVEEKTPELPARIRQATSDDVRHKVNVIKIKFEEQIKHAKDNYPEGDVENMKNKRIDLFKQNPTPDKYSQYIDNLIQFYQENERVFLLSLKNLEEQSADQTVTELPMVGVVNEEVL